MKNIIKRGLIAVAPLTLSLVVIYWLLSFLEEVFGPIVRYFIGNRYYYPGMGVVLALLILFLAGAVLNTWIMRKAACSFDHLAKKIPFFKSLYLMVQSVVALFRKAGDDQNNQVVKVTCAGGDFVGFVTSEDLSDLPEIETEKVAVYFPMSYQLGGYTVFIDRSSIEPMDIPVEKALQNILTAWAKPSNQKEKSPKK